MREGGGGVAVNHCQPTELCFSAMYCSQVSRRSGEFWYLQIQQCTSHTCTYSGPLKRMEHLTNMYIQCTALEVYGGIWSSVVDLPFRYTIHEVHEHLWILVWCVGGREREREREREGR